MPKTKYKTLITVLRVLGHKEIATAIQKTQPNIDPTNASFHENCKYLKMIPNTPLHAQFDLLDWGTITKYVEKKHPNFTFDFDNAYNKLESKS